MVLLEAKTLPVEASVAVALCAPVWVTLAAAVLLSVALPSAPLRGTAVAATEAVTVTAGCAA